MHGIGRCFSLFGISARTALQVINESTSLTSIKNHYLPISYHSFLCISISVVVPSDNSAIYAWEGNTASPCFKGSKNLIEEKDTTLVDNMRSSSHGSLGTPCFNLPIG